MDSKACALRIRERAKEIDYLLGKTDNPKIPDLNRPSKMSASKTFAICSTSCRMKNCAQYKPLYAESLPVGLDGRQAAHLIKHLYYNSHLLECQ